MKRILLKLPYFAVLTLFFLLSNAVVGQFTDPSTPLEPFSDPAPVDPNGNQQNPFLDPQGPTTMALDDDPGGPINPGSDIPLDGGIGFLLAIGAAYKLRNNQARNPFKNRLA